MEVALRVTLGGIGGGSWGLVLEMALGGVAFEVALGVALEVALGWH